MQCVAQTGCVEQSELDGVVLVREEEGKEPFIWTTHPDVACPVSIRPVPEARNTQTPNAKSIHATRTPKRRQRKNNQTTKIPQIDRILCIFSGVPSVCLQNARPLTAVRD